MDKQKAKEPFVYDKAKYHYDGEFPQGLPHEQGFVHTGMFLGWVIDSEMYSEQFKQELDGYIVAFRAREMTGPKVFEACDGVLMDDMLSDEGNSFAQDYFVFGRGNYLRDYMELLGKGLPTPYHVQNTWENYEKLKKRIERRYGDWKRKESPNLWKRIFG
jgi:hypothetical protein